MQVNITLWHVSALSENVAERHCADFPAALTNSFKRLPETYKCARTHVWLNTIAS